MRFDIVTGDSAKFESSVRDMGYKESDVLIVDINDSHFVVATADGVNLKELSAATEVEFTRGFGSTVLSADTGEDPNEDDISSQYLTAYSMFDQLISDGVEKLPTSSCVYDIEGTVIEKMTQDSALSLVFFRPNNKGLGLEEFLDINHVENVDATFVVKFLPNPLTNDLVLSTDGTHVWADDPTTVAKLENPVPGIVSVLSITGSDGKPSGVFRSWYCHIDSLDGLSQEVSLEIFDEVRPILTGMWDNAPEVTPADSENIQRNIFTSMHTENSWFEIPDFEDAMSGIVTEILSNGGQAD